MIEVECECGRVIKTKDENAGKKARCPDCGEVVQIPAPRKAGSKSPASSGRGAAAVKSSKRRPPTEDEYDGSDDEDEDFGGDEDEAEVPRSRLKKPAGKRPAKAKGDAEEPVAKKKKKKNADDTDLNKNIIIGTIVVFGVAFLGLIGYAIANLSSISSAPKIEVPKDYVDFSSPNGELTCQAPKDWETKTGGGSGGVPPFATFERGNVKIQFRSSPSGASLQMIATAGGADEKDLPDELKPVSRIHDLQKEKFIQEMSGYEEQGAPEMINTKNGEGRLSAFTASEGFSKIFGYRVTLLGTTNQWIVTCKCSASQWKDFQPVFRKVVESARGT